MRIRYFLLLFLLCLFGCSSSSNYKLPPDELITNRIILETADELKEKYDLRLIGLGGKYNHEMKKTEIITLRFQVYKPLTKDEARILMFNATGLFLKNINEDPDIQQYLLDRPFTEKNLDFTIFITDTEGRDLYDPNIAVVALYNGKLKFLTNDPVAKNLYKSKMTESLEEAHKIVREQTSSQTAF